MHLSFPNYRKWNSSVLGHFFDISSLNEKYKSIRLLNLLFYFSEIVLPSSQLFVHWFLVLHQVTELLMHLTFPNYHNWNLSVLGHFFKISSLNEKYESIGLLDLLCLTTLSLILSQKVKRNWSRHQVTENAMLFCRLCFFPRSYLFTDLLVLHQVTELVVHLSFPNYQNWNSSVLGHFFEISSLNEKYESIRLLNVLFYFSEIVLLSSQLFVHWFLSFASSYWTCYAFEFSKLSKLKFKCFESFLQNF